jgi:hypothetical protein
MFGTLLAATEVAAIEGDAVTLRLLDQTAGHAEGIDHKRDAVAKLLREYVTGPVRIKRMGLGSGEEAAVPPASRPSRLTEERVKADRLKALRTKDPTLNAAVDALDLELLE